MCIYFCNAAYRAGVWWPLPVGHNVLPDVIFRVMHYFCHSVFNKEVYKIHNKVYFQSIMGLCQLNNRSHFLH